VLQITSAEPEDGKSTLACNLALAIAQSGKKVLLLDADLRRPRIQNLFGLRGDIGLTDVLSGEIEWRTAVVDTRIPRLSVLGAGQLPPNPAELLAASAFEALLSDMRRDFDYVLVDTPPLLAVSDPCVVAAATDAVLLVVNISKNRRDTIRRVQQTIATHGMKVLGVIVNGVTPEADYVARYEYADGSASEPKAKDRDTRRRPERTDAARESVRT
jgi:capsular exopolysaccharide synthesis family protein